MTNTVTALDWSREVESCDSPSESEELPAPSAPPSPSLPSLCEGEGAEGEGAEGGERRGGEPRGGSGGFGGEMGGNGGGELHRTPSL